jgi:WD40 repeat protein
MTGHDSGVNSVAFSHDGSRIVSGSWDTTLRLWDAKTGQPIGAPLTGHDSGVHSVGFSLDGARIVSASEDGTLRQWPTDFEQWASLLCSKLTRNMSRADWKTWVSQSTPYRPQCPGLPIAPDPPTRAAPASAAASR